MNLIKQLSFITLPMLLLNIGCSTTQHQPSTLTQTKKHMDSTHQVDTYRLPKAMIGGREGFIHLAKGQIIETQSGKALCLDGLKAELQKADVIIIGEHHASYWHQYWEAKIIELLAQDKEKLAIGFEMFPRPMKERFNKRHSYQDERAFIEAIDWYKYWGHDYRYYRPIIRAIMRFDLPMVALNAERKWSKRLAKKGYDSLSAEEKAELPKLDFSSKEHQLLFAALLAGQNPHRKKQRPKKCPHQHQHKSATSKPVNPHKKRMPMMHHGSEMMDRFYQAQVLWDTTMAESIFEWIKGHPAQKIIALAGVGHVMYHLGISKRLKALAPNLNVVTLIPTIVEGESRKVSVELADYLIGIKPDPKVETIYPSLGIRTEKDDELKIETIKTDSFAEKAGFKQGDRLISVDGHELKTLFDLQWSLVDKKMGDSIKLSYQRDDQTLDAVIRFKK